MAFTFIINALGKAELMLTSDQLESWWDPDAYTFPWPTYGFLKATEEFHY